MNIGFSIIIDAAIIAAGIAVSSRYSIIAAEGNINFGHSYAWRLDRWTGKMTLCANYFAGGGTTECHPARTD